MEAIISAVVSAVSAIVVCVVQHQRTVALLDYKIEQLTEQVKKHNSLIERMYEVEKKVEILEEVKEDKK